MPVHIGWGRPSMHEKYCSFWPKDRTQTAPDRRFFKAPVQDFDEVLDECLGPPKRCLAVSLGDAEWQKLWLAANLEKRNTRSLSCSLCLCTDRDIVLVQYCSTACFTQFLCSVAAESISPAIMKRLLKVRCVTMTF